MRLYAKHESNKPGSDWTVICDDLKTIRGVQNRLTRGRFQSGVWRIYRCMEQDWNMATTKQRVRCDQCVLCSINGVACHEHGCPNTRKFWAEDTQRWVKILTCFECGCEYPDDMPCESFAHGITKHEVVSCSTFAISTARIGQSNL